MKYFLLALLALGVIAGGVGIYVSQKEPAPIATETAPQPVVQEELPPPPPAPPATVALGPTTLLGKSVSGKPITAYHFGVGKNEIVLIGGIHGGYSWGTSLLGYELLSYVRTHPEMIPDGVSLTIIPTVNPDGLQKVTATSSAFTAKDITPLADMSVARFNANGVDLNRNFDCKWQAKSTWQNKTVSGGSKPVSEPEAAALAAYLTTHKPAAAIVWYGAEGAVYASECENGVASSTRALMNTFAAASKYPAQDAFDSYQISGDLTNWMASVDIPAISVLLKTHEESDFAQNLAGLEAVLATYAN